TQNQPALCQLTLGPCSFVAFASSSVDSSSDRSFAWNCRFALDCWDAEPASCSAADFPSDFSGQFHQRNPLWHLSEWSASNFCLNPFATRFPFWSADSLRPLYHRRLQHD